ncbi:MAG: hypothetical protein M3R14_15460 [Acidobacteriota bacterium]|nr:hypothetical protein [Acidobacteriota bacterium]
MNFWRMATKIFAFFSLLFAGFISANAQSDSSIYELQAGTVMLVQMDNEINSKVSSVNDTFTTKVVKPVIVRETVVLPTGTIIEGRIIKVKPASSGGKDGSLAVSFEILRLVNGERRKIEGVLVNQLKADSSPIASVLAIIGGTALGGIFGAVSKAENGALIGAGIGAGAGTSVALLRKGKNVSIKADEKFEIELTKNVTLPVTDY